MTALSSILSNLDEMDVVDIDGTSTLVPKNGENFGAATPVTEFDLTGDDSTGSWDSGATGANILYDTDHWANQIVVAATQFNDGNYNTNASSPYVVSATSSFNATYAPWKAFNGALTVTATDSWVPAVGTPQNYLRIDLGTGLVFSKLEMVMADAAGGRTYDYIIQGSDNASTWTDLTATLTRPASGAGSIETETAEFDNSTSYRYYQVLFDSVDSNTFVLGLNYYESQGIATADNTIDSNVLAVGSTSYATGTTICRDENGTEISGTGKINLAYYNGSTWSSLVDLETFKALGTLTYANLKIRVQPVGAQTFQNLEIDTPGANIVLDKNGDVYTKVNGVEQQRLSDKANLSDIVNYLEVDQSNYTVLDDDGYAYIYVTCGSADRTVTLPTLADNDKRRITIKKVDIGTGLLIIDGEGAETIDGAANHTVCNKDGLLQAQAVNGKWFISVPNGEVYSEIYQVANATATTINTVDVWEQILNYSAGLACNVAVASSNMTLGIGAGGLFQISASISGVPAAVNKTIEFALSINDTIQTKTTQSRKFASTTDAGSVSLSGLLQLTDGDVVKMEMRNITDDGNFTVQNSNVVIHKL